MHSERERQAVIILAVTSLITSIGHTFTSVRLLTCFRRPILLAVAVSSLFLLEALLPVQYAEAQTATSIQGVAVTSDPGEDGGYGLNDEIVVELTFNEGVSATGTPQLTLDVGGRQRTAGYSGAGTSTGQLLFTYTVAEEDEDTDGIAVVANSLALNGGAIRSTQSSLNASLTHPTLQADGHLVDGIAPTVRLDGVDTARVSAAGPFNVFFNFSEPVFGITNDDVIVTNGSARSTNRTAATTEHPENTRWLAVIQPAGEGPVSVDLRVGAATDAFGNGNTASSGALNVIAADPVTVDVIQGTSGFSEGGDAEFVLTRSRDSGATTVSLSVEKAGEFMSGTAEISQSVGATTTLTLTFIGATATLEVTFAAGETRKTISFPTENDALDEPDGTITLTVAANPAQYQYIPGSMYSAVSQVRDNDEPFFVYLAPDHTVRTSLVEGEVAEFRLSHAEREDSPVSAVYLEFTEGLDLLDLGGAAARGYTHLGGGRIRVDLSVQYVTRFYVPTLANETIGPGGRLTLVGSTGEGYVFSERWMEWTYLIEDDDTPSAVTIDAPASVTEGDEVRYTITRTQGTGQSRAALTVNLQLEQTGDYVSWPPEHQPGSDGRYTIPLTFAPSSRVTSLTLTTNDDDLAEVNGILSALLLPSANNKYTVATIAQNTVLRDNEQPQVSVAVVAGRVTEGEDVQFRFTRFGDDSTAVRVGLWVGGLQKIMTDATEAIALTADNADLSQRLHIHGAWVDYILEFAAGEAEKTLSFTTEADNVNEGDGWLGVTIVQRAGNPFAIGAGYAQVHIDDDDIPTVSFSQVTLPTGAATLEGDTWVADADEGQAVSWVVSCSGSYEYSPLVVNPSVSGLIPQLEHLRLANHPAYYHHRIGVLLGNNSLSFVSGGLCDGQARTHGGTRRFVGPDGGVETFKLVPKDRQPAIVAEYREAYRQAKAAANAAGTPITQHDIIHERAVKPPHSTLIQCRDEPRYCPQYRVGTPHTIRLTLVNRDPTILIKAESTTVEEGQAARFIVERLWHDDLLRIIGSGSETVVALRASQNGQYITGALPTEITFGRNETSKTIELATVDDSAFSANGSVTIELLPDTTSADLNISGKYEISEQWSGHTPEGGRSDQATVTITNNDTKPSITIAPASAVEGDTGSADMTFTVTLAKAVTEAVTVNYATSDGTATAGQDYTAVSNGSVTIAANTTTAEFTVSVTGDETDEFDETFNVTISLPSDVTAAAIFGGDSATVTGTIIDDDPVMVTIAADTATVEEGEDAVFTLTRSGDTSEELLVIFVYRGDGSQETLTATFEPGSSTTEVSHTTVDDVVVNYPPERQYEAVLLGDSLGGGNVEDDIWSPGTPASATVTVTDNDVLATVTVHAQQAFATERGPIRAIFRRTGGNISLPLTIDYLQFFLRNDAETQFGAFEQITFPANQAEVTSSDFTAGLLAGDNIINLVPNSGDLYVPWTLTTVIYGDGGPNGFHRSWEAGIPNTASTVLYDDDVTQGLELHAQYSHRAARGDQVTITFTVMNTGTVTTGSPITITSVQRDDNDSDLDGQPESRVGCTITSAISVGASASCTATFTIGQTDFENTPLELDATASDSTATSKPFRIYITILDGILVGFRETDALQITEGASSIANLVVTRDGSLEEEVQVAYITRPFEGYNPNAALEGDDYTDTSATPGTITFGANQAEATISLNILQDGLFENRERFEVVLQAPDGVAIAEGKGIRRVVIVDFRSLNYRPVATLHRIGEQSVMEDAGSVEFAVRLTHAARQLLRYDVSLDPGVRGARAGADFVDPTMTVALAPGELEQTFTVALIDDNEVEDPEDFRVRMTGHIRNPNPSWATLATPTTARVTIVDDDLVEPSEVRLAVSIRNVITEATSQRDITVTASFHIETPAGTARTFVPYTEDTTVSVQFDPASSADPTDFQAFGVLEVVIPAGQTSGSSTLEFRPVDDDIDEDNERVILAGSVVANSFVDSSLPVVPVSFVFLDNDTRGITVTPGFVMSLMEEGDSGAYTVVLDSQPTETVTIGLQLDEIGQLNVSTKMLTFDADNWNVLQTVTVWAEDDGIIEVNQSESIEHEVSGGDYDQFTLETVVVSITDTTVAYVHLEGARVLESSGNLEFTIRISPPQPTSAVTVQYSTADGTATGGSDYTRVNGSTLSIPLGQDSATIAIPITNDNLDEADVETFTLRLTLPTAATLTGGVAELTATGSIVDDDDTPVLTISGPDGALSYVAEDTSVPVTFTLSLSGGSSEDVTLDYATGLATGDISARSGLGRATEGDDYIAASGVVTFLPGEKAKTITVQVQDDHISEGTEFFGLNLSNLRNAEFTNQHTEESASVGILDNDTRGVVISRYRIVLEEPRQGATATTDSYSVVLTSQPTATTTVAVDDASNPAVSLDKTSLTFTALDWNTPQTITITPVRDADAIDEFVTVSHTVTGGDYEGLRADDVGVRVDDSDARDVIVSQSTLTLPEGSDDTYTVKLATQPVATTTVSVAVAGDAQLNTNPSELTFTTSSWNTPQTITLTATQDDDASDNTATLTHVASGSDYVSVTRTVLVTVTDDDVAGVSVSEASLTIAEGSSGTYTIVLDSQPTADVTVTINDPSNTDVTAEPASLTFSSTDWNTPKTVTVNAAQDADAEDETATVTHTVTSTDSSYSGASANSVTVSITDDEVPVTVQFGATTYEVVEGETVTVAVTLSADPERTVVIPITHTPQGSTTSADYSGLPPNVTFNTGQMSQTITFTATQDDVDDGGKSVLLGFGTTLPGGVSLGTTVTTTVSITDDDGAGVSVSKASLTIAEGSSGTYTIVLDSQPTADVTVTINDPSNTDVTAEPASLTFSSTDWNTPKTVTVNAAQDADAEDETATVTHTVTSTDSSYSGASASTVTVTITDDEVPVTVQFGATTYEVVEGETVTVAVTLSADPERTVVILITHTPQGSTTSADYSGLPPNVTFNTGQMSQTITFTATQDDVDDGGKSVLLGFGTTLPGGVSLGTTVTTTVSITDDDGAGVSVSKASLTIAEGSSGTYTIVLDSQPTADVTVTINDPSNTDVTAEPASLTFSSTDWNTPKTVTVNAAQDADAEDETATVTHTVTSTDSSYSGASASTVTVTITDDEVPVTVQFGATTYEVVEGETVTVAVTLSADPERTVVILITHTPQDGADSPADYSGVPPSVTFNTGQMSQTITFTATQDDVDDGGKSVLLGFGTTLPGGVSLGTTVTTTVSITDDDGAGVSVSKASLTIAEGSSGTYTIVLDSQPTADVTVTINDPSNTDVTAEPASLTFSSTDWNTPKTVTVNAAQDADAEDETATVTHTVTSTDSSYSGASANSVTVTITDDEVPVTVQFGATTYEVVEGETVTVAVTLSADPERTVVILITHTPQGSTTSADYSGLPPNVTFNTGQMSQTITFTATQDDVDDGGKSVLLGFGTTLPGGVSLGTTVTTTVSITDDDGAGVSVSKASLTIAEGSSGTYTIVLDSQPTADVTVTINDPSNTDVTAEPASLTFSSTDWNTPKTVTVNAAQDADAEDETATVTHTVTSTDSSYSGASANSVTVTITDDEVPVTVQFGATTYEVVEGETVTVAVTLSADPERTVVILITHTPQGSTTSADYSGVPPSVTFNTGQMSQTITFTAAQDDVDDGGKSVLLGFGTTLPGGVSLGTTVTTTVSITDDDGAGVSVSKASLTIAEGSSGTYTIVLDSQPTADVTVTINDPSNTDVTAEPASLTFSSTDWNTPKTVTVNAAQDADAEDETATVTHTVTSTDSSYSGASASTVTVTITDDEVPVTVQFGATTYEVVEGETVTVAVTLSADPERTVVILITHTPQDGADSPADYSGVPPSVTFNTGQMSQTITFTAAQDDVDDGGKSVLLGFGTTLPGGVTEGTPNEARVTIKQVSTQFSLDCSLTATVWCADLGFSDRVAENYGWLYMRYGHGWDPPSSLSDDDFRFRGVDYDVRSMELQPGTHPVMPNAWSRWQQGYSSFRIGIYWDYRWGAPSEEHYRDWVLHLDGLELPFKDALRHGGDFVWVGEEFQQVFNNWTPSTVTKIGIEEVAAADQDTNPLLPWAPMQVDAWPEGPDRLLIVWAKPAWFYPGLPDPTSYIVQWKLASADWSDSAAVSQLEVAATSNFQAVIVNGMAENAVYSVRVIASNDAGDGPPSEETLGRPQDSLPRLIARTVNGQTLTLRFSKQLDPNAVPAATDFVVMADGGLIMVDSVAISGDEVILTLHHAVTAATHSVLVRYDKPTDPSAVFLQDTNGNYANIRQHHELLEVVNITPESSVQPLTAHFTNMPSSHDGRTRFTFDIEFSEPVWIGDGLARDDMLEITGGTVISAPWKDRRTDKFIVHVRPDTQGDIVIVLPGHRACHGIAGSYQEVPDPVLGAPCAIGSRVLTNEPTVTIPGPSSPAQQVVENTPAEGEPQINGIPEVGQTLSADTTAISDADGLENAVFQYQWLAEDADISGATGATYTVVSGDVGQAIRVRVTFTDDAGHEETLTSAPTVVTAGLQLQSATVDGAILTLTYNEELDTGVTLGTTAFAVNVNGSSRLLIAVGVGESHVLLLLSSAVEAGDTVTVDYTAPDGPDFIRGTQGRKVASFSGQAVTNNTASAPDETASAPLTASAHDAPSSHNGQDAFTFELRFREAPEPDFSYATVRDHAFTVTGGAVTYVRRLEPGKNVRWEITVTPGSGAAVAMALNATTDCSAQGAICTEDGRMLTGGLQLAVPGPNTPATETPNTPATGSPTITGAAQVGETLTADTTGISDGDGLNNAAFAYQWLADDAELYGANTSAYTLVADDEGKAIKVSVSFTDDAGNDEELTSAVTSAVVAAEVAAAVVNPPLTAAIHDLPSSHNGQNAFTFEMRFSEDPKPNFSYTTVRDHAFTVTGGLVTYVRRLEPGKNVRWEITVTPGPSADVTIALNATTDCSAQGAICTEDGRMLSNRLELTVNGPGQ